MEISDLKQSQSFVAFYVAGMVESIIGCKWSLGVLQMVHQGINLTRCNGTSDRWFDDKSIE